MAAIACFMRPPVLVFETFERRFRLRECTLKH